MPDPGRKYTDPMAWWGTISASAKAHETTAEMFGRIKAEAERNGWTLPPGGAIAFNELRSMAAGLGYSAERLAGARDTDAILGSHLAPLPYGGKPGGPLGPRTFDVRVNYTAIRSGQPESSYVTLRYTGGLPSTVGELRLEAADIATSLVDSYGAELTEVGDIEIGEL